jgi:outer membrane protein OmpA-like peptidoglycan-associated protein
MPAVVVAPVDVAPPTSDRAPRFDTAALPPGNISSAGDCLTGVRGAAQQVEVHFGHGRAMLDTAGKALIDRLIGALNICPEAKISVSGHADASGLSRRNLALSKHRARAVASYMTQKGIDAERLDAIGYGDKRPVVPNDTQANMARNRRIELAITTRRAPLPPMPVRKQGMFDGLSRR